MKVHVSHPLTFLIVSIAASGTVAASSGSYWVVYMGDAPESCAAAEAGEAVDPSCCTDFGPQFGLITDSFEKSCFVIPGLLGEGGGSLMSYLGCDGGIPKYGEGCYNNGENGGIIPDGVVVDDTDVANIEECVCRSRDLDRWHVGMLLVNNHLNTLTAWGQLPSSSSHL